MKYETDAYAQQITTQVLGLEGGAIVLEDTVFYPTGGGQPGDTGHLVLPNGQQVQIIDTRRSATDKHAIVHVPATEIDLPPGTTVVASLDWERRYRHMRMHTCLHLLATFITAPVTGSSISAERGRLDFDLPDPTLERESITGSLMELIARGIGVSTHLESIEQLQQMPEIIRGSFTLAPGFEGPVRIVEIEGLDRQPCGGTHVANTAEIGAVHCTKIEKKSRHNRRVVIEFVG